MDLLQTKIEPDIDELISVIKREKMPKRVHHIELFLDAEIKEQVIKMFDLDKGFDPEDRHYQIKCNIKLHEFLGYDLFWAGINQAFWKVPSIAAADTTAIDEQSRGDRGWADEQSGPIQSWEDFEKYDWPKISDLDLEPYEWLDKNLPENMSVFEGTAHILEMPTWLMGFQSLAMKTYDEPDLVEAIFEKSGELCVEYTKLLCQFNCNKIIWGSDDLGFRSSTLLSADYLREKVLPWHKKCAQSAHENGRPYFLHSCGNLEGIMDDLIDDVKIDARHSWEDAIMPVTEAKKKYGQRMAILGGIDMDFICRADEQAIRKRVRETLDVCMPGSGYCLGTGNTVANYVPVENYLIMLDEGRKYQL